MHKFLILPLAIILLSSCASRSSDESPIVSMQIVGRNGTSETISNGERLNTYQKVDFLSAQPYQKILRVFKRDKDGKSQSKITTYHPNGQIHQYLEVKDGRAFGLYREWYETGKGKIEATVIEGNPDVSENAQASWLFDGKSTVWDEQGNLIAEIFYDKGMLHEPSLYYYPNGSLEKKVPYIQNEIEGIVTIWDSQGNVQETIPYQKGVRQGNAIGFWESDKKWYEEEYENGLLQNASYFNPEGEKIAEIRNGDGIQAVFQNGTLQSLIEYHKGVPDGQVTVFDFMGRVLSVYHIKENKKHGEEITYYPQTKLPLRTKLSLFWDEGIIQGVAKTWYENGQMESQREIHNNKKQGLSFAWYKDGDLMFMEEYENDLLTKGSYFKKGEKNPISQIENGKGIATVYDKNGIFLKKISYEKGNPVLESDD